jgi:hypothetical protein
VRAFAPGQIVDVCARPQLNLRMMLIVGALVGDVLVTAGVVRLRHHRRSTAIDVG